MRSNQVKLDPVYSPKSLYLISRRIENSHPLFDPFARLLHDDHQAVAVAEGACQRLVFAAQHATRAAEHPVGSGQNPGRGRPEKPAAIDMVSTVCTSATDILSRLIKRGT